MDTALDCDGEFDNLVLEHINVFSEFESRKRSDTFELLKYVGIKYLVVSYIMKLYYASWGDYWESCRGSDYG